LPLPRRSFPMGRPCVRDVFRPDERPIGELDPCRVVIGRVRQKLRQSRDQLPRLFLGPIQIDAIAAVELFVDIHRRFPFWKVSNHVSILHYRSNLSNNLNRFLLASFSLVLSFYKILSANQTLRLNLTELQGSFAILADLPFLVWHTVCSCHFGSCSNSCAT